MDLITDRNRAQATRQRHRACQTSVIPVVNHHCSNLNYNLWYSIASLHRWKRDGNFRAIFSNNFSNRFSGLSCLSFHPWRRYMHTKKKEELLLSELFFESLQTQCYKQREQKNNISPVWRSYILFLLICETKQKIIMIHNDVILCLEKKLTFFFCEITALNLFLVRAQFTIL